MTLASVVPIRHPLSVGDDTLVVAGVVRSSVVDGPGHRYVLFLQGCNFDCLACHNPTTIGRCDACGVCIDACSQNALLSGSEGTLVFDPVACDDCGDCLRVCPIDADPTVRPVSIDEIVTDVAAVAPFLSGVTITGGEPTRQLRGLVRLLRRLGEDPRVSDLTRLIDTNGSLDPDGWEELLPHIEGAMVDLKAATPARHRRLTGHDNAAVVDSLRLLHRHGKLTEVRLLVIEGETDGEEELACWAEAVSSVGPDLPVRTMAFRRRGTRPVAHRWPDTSAETMDRVRTLLTSFGLTNVT